MNAACFLARFKQRNSSWKETQRPPMCFIFKMICLVSLIGFDDAKLMLTWEINNLILIVSAFLFIT